MNFMHVRQCAFGWESLNDIWTTSSEFGTYRLCEQRRFRRACASAQSRQNLRCSLIQGHAQLKFVMTECSKTQIRLTGLILKFWFSLYFIFKPWIDPPFTRLHRALLAQAVLQWNFVKAFVFFFKQEIIKTRNHENFEKETKMESVKKKWAASWQNQHQRTIGPVPLTWVLRIC